MLKMFKPLKRESLIEFLHEEDAATAVEYAVMVTLIVAVCAASVSFLASKTHDSFNTSGAAITGAFGN